jgi:hypothetical protein
MTRIALRCESAPDIVTLEAEAAALFEQLGVASTPEVPLLVSA